MTPLHGRGTACSTYVTTTQLVLLAGGKKVGVITGKAKLYTEQDLAEKQQQQERQEAADDRPAYSAAAIALMGAPSALHGS